MMSTVLVAGQGCLFPTRLLVQDSIYDAMVDRIRAFLQNVSIGDPLSPTTMMGPVISQRAVDRIVGYIDEAKARHPGALLAGGNRIGGDLANGFFIEPTVFGDLNNDARIAREEIFGPVLTIIRFKTEEEAIAIANDTTFGLAGYVHTNDLRRAHRVSAALEAGYIGINSFPPMSATAPFGGWKQSGYGKEGGRIGVEEFLRAKNVHLPL
jgi:aldehyde dehydrogenase (NAD+)